MPQRGTIASTLLVAKVLSAGALARLGTHCGGPLGACSDPEWSIQRGRSVPRSGIGLGGTTGPKSLEKDEHTEEDTLALSLVHVIRFEGFGTRAVHKLPDGTPAVGRTASLAEGISASWRKS